MAGLTRKGRRKKGVLRRTYEVAESKVMAAVGRRALRTGTSTVKKVTRRAVKAALLAGSLAAAKVVLDEVRERRRRAV
jgi:hypothetical protein